MVATLDEVAPAIRTMNVSVNQSMNLEKESEVLRTDLTLAEAKLSELNAAFHERELRTTPLSVFHELSGEIGQQQLIVEQLRRQFTEVESGLAEQRRRNALAFDRQQKINRQIELTQQLRSIETKLATSLGLIQAMKMQIDLLLPEKNVLLQELAALKQQLGENGVN
jgi:hypothetical protein